MCPKEFTISNYQFKLRIYPKERTYKDAGLYFRIKSLDWIDYNKLDIDK